MSRPQTSEWRHAEAKGYRGENETSRYDVRTYIAWNLRHSASDTTQESFKNSLAFRPTKKFHVFFNMPEKSEV